MRLQIRWEHRVVVRSDRIAPGLYCYSGSDAAAREKIQWDAPWLGYALTKRFSHMADDLALRPRGDPLQRFNQAVDLVRSLPFEVDLAHVQNVYYQLQQHVYPVVATEGSDDSKQWITDFSALGQKLGFSVEQK